MAETSNTARSQKQEWASVPQKRLLLLVSIILIIAGSEFLLWHGNSFEKTPWWIAALFPCFSFVAASKCFQTMTRAMGSEKVAWRFFGMGCASLLTGQLAWSFYEQVLNISNPSPSIADIGYLLFPVFFVIGIWNYQLRAPFTDDTIVRIGNLGIVLSATLLVYLFAYAEFLRSPIPASLATITVAYGVLDLSALLFALAVVTLHTWGSRRRIMLLILIGLCFPAIMDIDYIYDLAMGSEYKTSSLLNGQIFFAMSFVFWAAFEQDHMVRGHVAYKYSGDVGTRGSRWESMLPPFAVAGVLIIGLFNQDQLVSAMMPFFFFASALFVTSLAVHNWWGQRLEAKLREEASQSHSKLKALNRELKLEIAVRGQVQEELRQAQKMKALGQLTGGIAHDFNNLLAVILGNLELLENDSSTTPNQLELLRDVTSAAERGHDMTQRLLSLARKQHLRTEPVDINTLLGELKTALRRTLGEDIQVRIAHSINLWKCLADHTQLEHAILNLAINSRDSMPGGGVLEIETSNIIIDRKYVTEHPEAKVGTYVSISVIDTGMGIPEKNLNRVFEPFFTTKEASLGTGLGLSMVYGFLKQSGGHVAIESELGQGTRVSLFFPSSKSKQQRVDGESPKKTAFSSALQ